MIQRKQYLEFLIGSKDKQIIKVISGVRRCGKSTLFELYKNFLLEEGIDNTQIISINFEDIDYEYLTNYKDLYEYIKTRLIPNKMNYVFLDEIEHVQQFEKAVDSLFIKQNVDLYITGSNAYFMSSELATLLSGRYIELKMLPLSFKEYCEGYKASFPNDWKSKIELYNSYLTSSSFPYVLQIMDNKKDVNDYLQGIYSTILLKDVVARCKIADVKMLESVIRFIFDSIGSLLSINKIANTMTSNGRKVDNKTIEKYINALVDSLMIYPVTRYNIKGKQHLQVLEKYYVADIGLRYMLLGNRNYDVEHMLENIVYLELIRRGYQVYVGQVGEYKVDFVAQSYEETIYYQVAATARDKETLARELNSLQRINDNYPKIILTLDEDPKADYDGIKRINVLEWLLEE